MSYLTSQFHHDRHNHTFSQEFSVLGVPGRVPHHKLPSGIIGIILENSFTGTRYEFALTKVDMDASNEDVYGWNYEPTAETALAYPNTSSYKVLIIND